MLRRSAGRALCGGRTHPASAGLPKVILRWHHQLGSLPIPKSSQLERLAEDLDVFGFSLTEDEIAAVTGSGGGAAASSEATDVHEDM
jgi:2,5-diketo-D-gluconate reductase A